MISITFKMKLLGSATLFVVLQVVLCDFGAFVPKSFYIIAEDGNQSPLVLFRTKRSSGNSGSAYSSASASSSAGAGAGHFDASGFIPNFAHGDFSNLRYDFGPSNIPEGAKIFSRFGEEQGSGIHVSGSAQGPNGAFSSTSAQADDTGKVRYSVKSGKY